MQISLCPSFASQIRLSSFDECGFVRVEERGNDCAGDDTIIPSTFYGNSLLAFLNDDRGGKPPFFENGDLNVTVVIASQNSDACFKGDAWSVVSKQQALQTLCMAILISVVWTWVV